MVIDINTDAFIILTNKLEKIRRSALPNAVRGMLNSAAFDVKQRTMPEAASRTFEKRKPNFFKANSKVKMASGYAVNAMESIVGFTPGSSNSYNNLAVQELEQQEHGGTIHNRTFVPLDTARTGGSHSQMVRPGSRLGSLKGTQFIDSHKSMGINDAQQFLNAARYAGKGGFVIGYRGKKARLYQIQSVERVKGRKRGENTNRNTKVKARALYSFDSGRSVKIKNATHFMERATMITASRLPYFFAQNAERQIKRFVK